MLLQDFSYEKRAVINPSDIFSPVPDMPERAVACFSHVTFSRLLDTLGGEEIAHSASANGDIPVYKTNYAGIPLALFMMPVGAPLCIGAMEEIAAMGVQKFVIFGTCGVLDRTIQDCAVILPTSALRDEGTSFHYAPPSDEISCNVDTAPVFARLLKELDIAYMTGKSWTTDAFYRETPEKVARRREAGCICVEMECASTAAWAAFRKKQVLHFFYAADNLDAEKWDPRALGNHSMKEVKDRIAILAAEAAIRI